jgi:hypothetical protein
MEQCRWRTGVGDEELEDYQNASSDEMTPVRKGTESGAQWKIPDPFSRTTDGVTAVLRDGLLEGRADSSRHVLVFSRFAPGISFRKLEEASGCGD